MSPKINVHKLIVTPIQQNCRVIEVEGVNHCLIIDPGGDANRIISFLESKKLWATQIWLTHSHLDHCGGVKQLKEKYDCPLTAHANEAQFRNRVEESSANYGIPYGVMLNCPEPESHVSGNETLSFEGVDFKVLFTPGHSPGHVCFYQKDSQILLAGDTLFAGSIGRTDLPGGNFDRLIQSIKEEIFTLPDQTIVMSGHGPDTTVGEEKKSNPFVRE